MNNSNDYNYPQDSPLRFQLLIFLVFISAIAIALVTGNCIYRLNVWIDKSNRSELLLCRIAQQMSQINALEWEAISKQKIDYELQKEIDKNLQQNKLAFQDLQKIEKSKERLKNLLELNKQYQKALRQEFNLIAAKQIDQAILVDEEKVDPLYDKLSDEIIFLTNIYIEDKQKARKIANTGINFSLIVAALIIGSLVWIFTRKLWQKKQHLEKAFKELQQAQSQLIHQEKTVALGQLVGGIAHEINTPLGAIQASSNNIIVSVDESFQKLPSLVKTLPPNLLDNFFTLLQTARKLENHLSFREERKIKKILKQELETRKINNAEAIADTLSKMGISGDIEPFIPLLTITNNQSILETAYQLSIIYNNSQNIKLAVERSSKIVFALKNYVRQDTTNSLITASVIDGIETILAIYKNQLKRGVEVKKIYQPVPEILCYPEELTQVWSNLISNALQAMSYKGILTISVWQEQQQVLVAIEDTGCGIPLDIQSRIFEPFFTTKPVGEGSGLGLDTVSKIVGKHGGKVEFSSIPGHTKFSVWLPIAPVAI